MITFHKATSKDVLEIKNLLRETWLDTYSSIYSQDAINMVTSEWHSVEFLLQQIEDPKGSFVVAKDGEKLIGMCNATIEHETHFVNIQRLHVLPGYQRQGIGSNLMKEVIKKFPKAEKIELEVEKQNHRAYSFYKKHGFRKSGEKVFEVNGVSLPCIVMEKIV